MLRSLVILFVITVAVVKGPTALAEQPVAIPPVIYEVQINGESFLVEANRQTRLESKAKPGVRYEVAVRVAPTQHVSLNTVQFDYDLPAKVEIDDRGRSRSARLVHELGFSLLIRDLGRPLDSKGQDEALRELVKSVTAMLREIKAQDIDVTEPHQRTFGSSSARGITVRYRDAKRLDHVYLLYVLTGSTYSATCAVEYLENDSDDALPLIKKTLDSVRAIDRRKSNQP
jgi:hypothetical protein